MFKEIYELSTESLKSIVEGLDLKPTDDVLAVCGSGEQSLAILEFANSVFSVDINPKQLEYAEFFTGLVGSQDFDNFWINYDSFFDNGDLNDCLNKTYLSEDGRLETISKKMNELRFFESDITNILKNDSSFDKIYLSNAMEHISKIKNLSFFDQLDSYSQSLKPSTLIYHSSGLFPLDSSVPKNLEIEKYLTQKARHFEYRWNPVVYRTL
jgi:cyclopropane fatty-acyl-phospholipid synthase-like methyltransferase